jgi:FkbM family methyltransferase
MKDNPSAAPGEWGACVPSLAVRVWIGLCRALPASGFFRRVGLWLRRPLKYGRGGPIDTRIWGLKLRLNRRGNLSEERWLFLPQFSDGMERRILVERLRPGSVFLDIGANAGFYSFWVWSRFGDAVRIEAFEPDPELCGRIRFNLAANGIRSLHLNPLALSDRRGTACLQIGTKNRGTNRLDPSGADGVRVEMLPLSEFLAREGIERIDAMKIDVEGHEARILGPFFTHAPRSAYPRLLICETLDPGHGDDPLRELIEQAGYRPIARGRMNTVYQLDPISAN